MPPIRIACPYCGNLISITATQEQTGHEFSIKILRASRSSRITRPSYDLDCSVCGNRYEYVELADFSWIKNQLELSEDVLTSFKSIFPGEEWASLDFIFENITGIAKPRERYLHICFKINDHRVYLECYRTGNVLRAIGLNRC